jgi:prepilin-type N-terminal cleavage/methylation domain-containing protein
MRIVARHEPFPAHLETLVPLRRRRTRGNRLLPAGHRSAGLRCRTAGRADHGDAGFSLIEVLFALVILAVGVLALESMGIGAARSVRRARMQTAYAVLAADELEQALARIERAPAQPLEPREYTAADGSRVRREAGFTPVAGTEPPRGGTLGLWTVTVSVRPPAIPGVLAPSDSVRVTSRVLR